MNLDNYFEHIENNISKREELIQKFKEAKAKEDEYYDKKIAEIENKKQQLTKQLNELKKQYETL